MGRRKRAWPDGTSAALRRPKPCVVAEMASGTDIARRGEPLLVRAMRHPEAACVLERGVLFRQGRVTLHALGGRRGSVGQSVGNQSGRKSMRVQRGAPLLELIAVTLAAILWPERLLQRAPFGRRLALRRERSMPVSGHIKATIGKLCIERRDRQRAAKHACAYD